MKILRPYQSAAVQNLRLSLAGGFLRSCLYSPTGSGKTEIGMAIIRGAVAKSKRVVFLCNRIHLVEQASRRFYASGINHGIIQGDNTRNTSEPVIVGSIQTVARRGMPDCDLIVIDEAHGVAGSKDYRNILTKRSAVPVVGLTATPFAKGMSKHYESLKGPLFENLVIATTIGELIADGFLVDCEIYAPSEPDMSGVKTTRNAFGEIDWSDMDVANAVDKPQLVGDIVQHWHKLSYGLPTVCFASSILHSKHIVESFRASGVPAEHIDCYTKPEEREAILGRIQSGETLVISNVGILTEGWDFPACRTMILARPTRSMIRYIQMVGRVLRPSPGKEKALILDHSGTVARLGFPTDDLELELDDGSPKDGKQQKPEAQLPKKCPNCHHMKPPRTPVCPACGFRNQAHAEVEHAEGELVLFEKKKRAKPGEKQEVFSQLLAMRHQYGYAEGWVANQYRNYFGCWPKGLERTCIEPTPEIRSWVKSQQIRFAKSQEKKRAA